MDENCCPHCNRILGTHVTCPMCMKYLVIEGASLILPHHVKEAREMDLVPDPIRRVGYMDDMRIIHLVEEAMASAVEGKRSPQAAG